MLRDDAIKNGLLEPKDTEEAARLNVKKKLTPIEQKVFKRRKKKEGERD